MLQLQNLILYIVLLVLGIFLDFSLDVGYEKGEFSKILLKKSLEFILNYGDNTFVFNLSFMLLQIKVYSILEEQSCKGDALMACGISYIKIFLTLLTKMVAFHI